jgi:tetratricopeptide (TPR) repeat protein
MKIKNVLITGTLLVSVVAFSQKDELKALKKIYSKDAPTASDVADYKLNLNKLEPLATEESDKVYLHFFKGILPQIEMASMGLQASPDQLQKLFSPKVISDMVSGYVTTLDYEKKSGKKLFTDDINEDIVTVKPILINVAVGLGESKKYKEAGDILYTVYQLDKKDTEKLYYAASYAVNAKDYDNALAYYKELKAINYSGEATMYYAVNKSNNKEEYFGTSANERDLLVKTGQYIKPREEKVPSRKGEIYKNVVLILVEQGKSAEAKTAISDARKANPDDISLLITEADLYLKEKDYTTYSKIVSEAIEKQPNNVDLVFNLGVISADSGKLAEAENYYKKAIQLDPNYFNAYLNISELKLRADKDLVDAMKKLGTSTADNKKFDELRAKQNANYSEIMPYLEKAVELKPDNEAAKKTLLGVYQALDLTDKYKALKAKE